jgi:hypothetical protein
MPIQRIEFSTTSAYAVPSPHIDDGSMVILVVNGKANVSRYAAARSPEEPSPSFDHPVNVEALEAEAMTLVRAQFPDLNEEVAVFTCPVELAKRAEFRGVRRCV